MLKTLDVITEINLPELKLFKKGKVRNVYDLGENLLIVASDRISAFDHILPNGIPHKGAVLTGISDFWFSKTKDIIDNHLISTDVANFPQETLQYKDILKGRSMFVKKTELIEIECVVRGYLAGSGWKEYQKDRSVCGISLPAGLQLASPLPEPIFTPATKAAEGDHDENITIQRMKDIIGTELSDLLIEKSLAIYQRGTGIAEDKGIILADTKFEFGIIDNQVILIDEVLTPDSSRFWPKSEYQVGISPPSFDKQIIRDYLENTGWDKNSPPPQLSSEIIQKAAARYNELRKLLLQQ
ncbi:phosphoribosylaminoimidazolesuccinocarboxamide synthase [Candidatus Margulisiibacteriota bacterium]